MTEKSEVLSPWNVYCEPVYCEVDTLPLLISISIHFFFCGSFPHKYYPFKKYLPLARDQIIFRISFLIHNIHPLFLFMKTLPKLPSERTFSDPLNFWASLIRLTTKGIYETSWSRFITWANESFKVGYVS